jgi:hypothetical protein
MQKLSDDIWAGVYQDYLSGKNLSVIFWTNEVYIDAHQTPKAFTAAFYHYIDRNYLPERD